ncbi:hypothetical protein G6F59_017293 [Rhizopus arrhizus]|uniref:Uncharacterized protein n=1 Tax=Rhizopus delemar TaxID=936053 RepID=A0A9P6XS14_9FUNG|nr:hypothetical protein G6F59_017293 [Rhizopus arrhizus]KAG1531257.1 hypothetical protein G6F50_016802 [Rhizopus delemar]
MPASCRRCGTDQNLLERIPQHSALRINVITNANLVAFHRGDGFRGKTNAEPCPVVRIGTPLAELVSSCGEAAGEHLEHVAARRQVLINGSPGLDHPGHFILGQNLSQQLRSPTQFH